MSEYSNFLWTKYIKDNIHESDVLDDIEEGILKINKNIPKKLFPRYSQRWLDTGIMEVLHGSSTKFNSFSRSLGLNVNKHCLVCNQEDNSHHALYDCPKYSCESRTHIPKSEDHKLYALKILMAKDLAHLKAVRDISKIIMQ